MTRIISLVAIAVILGCNDSLPAQTVVWSPHATYYGRQVNLGPTGARGWVHDNRLYLVSVEAGSPGAGILQPHDAILGANGHRCGAGEDPRKVLGKAITESEGKDGRLTLQIERDGRELDVVVPLRALGRYAKSWPYDCGKSKTVLREGLDYLADRQLPNGSFAYGGVMAACWNGLFFLASGEACHLENARRAVYFLNDLSYPEMGLNNWPAGYAGVLLAEYYLATGDRTVLPKLQEICDFIGANQMACGSWAHNSPWGGYGAVNQVGLVCFMALILGEDCGMTVDARVMEKATRFFRQYAELGWIPYGDHRPHHGRSGNGKNALGAVVFELLGRHDKEVGLFGGSVAETHAWREDGHTGPFFSFLWGPLAAVHAPRDRFQNFLDEQAWYYDLARTWDGGLVCQPNAENLGGRTPGTYTWSGAEYTTGGMALFYALPRTTLRILGAPRGPFEAEAGKELNVLRELYWLGDRGKFDQAVSVALRRKDFSKEEKHGLERLVSAAAMQKESVALTLEAIQIAVDDEDPYRAAQLASGIRKLLGDDCPELETVGKLLDGQEENVGLGMKYYETWTDLINLSETYWMTYGRRAKLEVALGRGARPQNWQPIVKTSRREAQPWKVLRVQAGEKGLQGTDWSKREFDDASWEDAEGAASLKPDRKAPEGRMSFYLRRTFELDELRFRTLRLSYLGSREQSAEVYLNGVLVAVLHGSEKKNYAGIPLRAEAVAALRKGVNCLGIRCDAEGRQSLQVDLGLQGE